MQNFCVELVRLAHHVATSSPEKSELLSVSLRAALEIVDPGTKVIAGPIVLRMVEHLDDLAGKLVVLGDRAEWMAEQAKAVTTTPPPPELPLAG